MIGLTAQLNVQNAVTGVADVKSVLNCVASQRNQRLVVIFERYKFVQHDRHPFDRWIGRLA